MPSTQRDARRCIKCIPNPTLRGQVEATIANATCGQGATHEQLDRNARAMWFSYPTVGLCTPFPAKCWLCRQQRQCIPVDSPEGTVHIGTECVEKTLRKRDLFRAIRTGRVSAIREANDILATFVDTQRRTNDLRHKSISRYGRHRAEVEDDGESLDGESDEDGDDDDDDDDSDYDNDDNDDDDNDDDDNDDDNDDNDDDDADDDDSDYDNKVEFVDTDGDHILFRLRNGDVQKFIDGKKDNQFDGHLKYNARTGVLEDAKTLMRLDADRDERSSKIIQLRQLFARTSHCTLTIDQPHEQNTRGQDIRRIAKLRLGDWLDYTWMKRDVFYNERFHDGRITCIDYDAQTLTLDTHGVVDTNVSWALLKDVVLVSREQNGQDEQDEQDGHDEQDTVQPETEPLSVSESSTATEEDDITDAEYVQMIENAHQNLPFVSGNNGGFGRNTPVVPVHQRMERQPRNNRATRTRLAKRARHAEEDLTSGEVSEVTRVESSTAKQNDEMDVQPERAIHRSQQEDPVRQSMQATVNSLETTLEQQKKRKRSLEEQLNQLTRDIQQNENVLHEMTSYLSRNDGGERSAKRPRITTPTETTAQQMRHTM